jgi:DNA-binding transcriptional ArsR family regulator
MSESRQGGATAAADVTLHQFRPVGRQPFLYKIREEVPVIRPQSARAIKYSLKSAEGNLSSEYRRSQSLTFKLNIFLTCKDALPYIFHPLVNKHRRVTAVFAALAHPARRRILERLAGHGGTRVTELAKPFRISLPAISRHLRVLEDARLVRRHRHGREHVIRVNPAGMRDAQKWIARCAAGWEFSFDALDELLMSEERKEKKP